MNTDQHALTTPAPRMSIALLSGSALAYEILLMRLFSIIQWHHFAYMIISLALLGYGVSGTFLALNRRRLLTNYQWIFVLNVLLFAISTLLSFLLAQQIPFNPQEVLWDSHQPWYLLLLYLMLALPFFFAANAIGLALMAHRHDISHLYAADMLGAGFGSIAIIALLFILFPMDGLRFITTIGIVTAWLACWEMHLGHKLKWGLLFGVLLPWLLPTTWSQLEISPYKGLSQSLRIAGSAVVAEYSSPLGLLTVVENPQVPLHHAPGLSLNAHLELPKQVAVFTDGDAMTVINENRQDNNSNLERFAYLDQQTSALPYHLQKLQSVLVLGAGGGSEVLQAHYHHTDKVAAVELNPQMVDLLQQNYAQFSGELYNDNKTIIHIDEARGFVSGSPHQYDLIQVALLDAFGASSAGLYALSESYLYTVEALQEYLKHLTPNGYLAISRWIQLPPRDTLKLFATAVVALERNGVNNISEHVVLIRSWQISTLLVKNSPFSQQEIETLQLFCQQRAFDLSYYPAMPAFQANRYNRLREAFFYQAAQALLGQQRDSFLRHYKFNIQPATDDKPYFFNFFKWSVFPEVLTLIGKGGMSLLEWGYLLLIATLLQAFVVSLALILLPLRWIKGDLVSPNTTSIRPFWALTYFLLLGLAFLFIEIAFIQRFILFLHHPLYAVAVVLAAFLIFAGLGSAYSRRYSQNNKHHNGIKLAVSGIVMLGLLYLLILGPIYSLILDWSVLYKVFIAVLLIAPLAFCMGMPFPLGLSLLGDSSQNLIPWVWGINGCASVLSAVLASLLAIHFGFTLVVFLALISYAVGAFIFDRKLIARARA